MRGGGPEATLTEDIAFGGQKGVGQGHLICIVFEKETEQSTNSGFLFPDFCVYCFTEVFTSAKVQPSKSQGGRASMGPAAPWHPVAKGGVDRKLSMLSADVLRATDKPRLHSDRSQSPRQPSPGLGLP